MHTFKPIITAIFVSSIVQAGCAASSKSLDLSAGTTGGAGKDKALLVLAMGPNVTAGHFGFKPLTDDAGGFRDDYVALNYGAYGSADMLKRPEGEKSSFWKVQTDQVNFLAAAVEPGTWVATDTSFNGFNGVGTTVTSSCRRDGAVVFEVRKGAVNIVRSDTAFPLHMASRMAAKHTQSSIREAFVKTRENYPEIEGNVTFPAPDREARWIKSDEKFFGNACYDVQAGSMTLSRRGTSSAAMPDASDKAAIDAALENLNAQ